MDYERLYCVGEAWIPGALRVRPDLGDPTKADPIAIVRAVKKPDKPIACRHQSGGKPYDLIGTTYALDLFSDKVVRILREGGFTGWSTFPVEVYGKRSQRIEGYHGFAVTGRCGQADISKARKLHMPPPVPWGQSYDAWVGLYFDPETWDGSEVFMPENTCHVIIVEDVFDALTRAGVKNVTFKRLTEYEYSWPRP